MKFSKKILFLILLFISLSTRIFATGAGIQLSAKPSLLVNDQGVDFEQFTGRLIGTVKLSRIPVAAGFGFEAGKSGSAFAYGFTGFADYYAVDLQLKNTWNVYSGFGAEGSFLTSDFKNWGMSAGARFFIGMNWLFWDNYLEFYIQQNAVPAYTRSLKSSTSDSGSGSKGTFIFSMPFESGLRFNF